MHTIFGDLCFCRSHKLYSSVQTAVESDGLCNELHTCLKAWRNGKIYLTVLFWEELQEWVAWHSGIYFSFNSQRVLRNKDQGKRLYSMCRIPTSFNKGHSFCLKTSNTSNGLTLQWKWYFWKKSPKTVSLIVTL